jgi:ferredoxin
MEGADGAAERPSGGAARPMAKVTCLDRNGDEMSSVVVPRGVTLLHALQQVGFVYGACGGHGGCGGCAVELADGRMVLSCFVRVEDDVTVRKRR